MVAKTANTGSKLWERIACARDSHPELSVLRNVLSRNREASDALEKFLYSHYHYLLTSQRFEPDQRIKDMDLATANSIAILASLIFEDEKEKIPSQVDTHKF